MKKIFEIPHQLTIFLLLVNFTISAQPLAYFNACLFNTPTNQPYLETHLTFNGKILFAKAEGKQFRNSVQVLVRILKDTVPVKINKYNLNGPYFTEAKNAPSFIDNQRYALPEGDYVAEIILTDNYNPVKREFKIRHEIKVDFEEDKIDCSSIQALESFSQSASAGPLTKSGYYLVPYTVNYYPESTSLLSFYVETYNAEKILGEKKPFLYTYYLEKADDGTVLENYGAFKKQSSAPVSALLAKMDISNLPSGNYNLVVEVKDGENKLHKRSKYYFQRLNRKIDIATRTALSSKEMEGDYFGNCNNTDTLKMFVECLWPIADGVDKERIVNQSIKKDPELMKKFVVDFWQRRSADTANPVKMWGAYYSRVQQCLALFRCGKQKGYYTDRGRVYLQYGAPDQRSIQNNENNTFPYEIWQYYRLVDGTNGQFFSNKRFVFVNKNMGDDCHQLVHSDMRGEINNPRWQFELTKRNNQGIANPDNTVPAGTENNHFNDIYQNPR